MQIISIHGAFLINLDRTNPDKLVVKSTLKSPLQRIFDEKRIYPLDQEKFKYAVSVCKQELAHVLIMMIKEIDYADFEQFVSELNLSSDQAFA
ncbi:hypothetical protein A33Q_1109 [Indibacter alkaliphilus LW1]|jgi:hypothetical protein|uniref:Uncharacterized protein n=1 Tax=Indibacter alkaliphilus (strain CCUG 57479 / KCTC 22604 / LW1) TaxID=1189612 RepID=S2DMM6_INDAL|nr:hypothetical protein [Indibacter alkaliphilus]EOZ98455.1 hypothetical protein A33Q_1109 [Indibacter alkaliphilus LW1]